MKHLHLICTWHDHRMRTHVLLGDERQLLELMQEPGLVEMSELCEFSGVED